MAAKPRAIAETAHTAAASDESRPVVDFGRDVCGHFAAATEREWLVTNGIGGFAAGTISGAQARRYHGLLFAALTPPVGRTLLVSKIDETAHYRGAEFPLYANRWSSGHVDAPACNWMERFRLDGSMPVWTFAFADVLLEKRIWMRHGSNTTFVRYELIRGGSPLRLSARTFVNYRDYHSVTRAGEWKMDVQAAEGRLRVSAYDGATPFYLQCDSGAVHSAHAWHRGFDLAQERARGLEDSEDHLHAATFEIEMQPGAGVTLMLTTDAELRLDAEAELAACRQRERRILEAWSAPAGATASPGWIRQLVLAADQFVVRRPLAEDPEGLSLIAGYPWFADWGRDTMIALPGLALSTGRPEIARKILRTFARYVDRGMLPNNFPDHDAAPEYNTVDAALWFFEAVRQTSSTGDSAEDDAFLREMFPVLAEMVEWHLRGTRYQIHANADGLLYAGEPGVQLTWMDAKVGDWVVTPRIGKPVEINALWYNALAIMLGFTRRLGKATASYEFMLRQVESSFGRFWNADRNCLFDVLDGPDGNDPALRPNQLFAVSLPHSPLSRERQRAVVDAVCGALLTSHGLRSLEAGHRDYRGKYEGPPAMRDGAYHQGTVWSWLLGPFALAHFRAYGNREVARSFLRPMAHHLNAGCLGTISEIFDGDAPFLPQGCFAQAWSVAEILRAWRELCSPGGSITEQKP